MAIKNQCLKCLFYNTSSSLCDKYGSNPTYNSMSCDSYKSKYATTTINLEKNTSTYGNNGTTNQEPQTAKQKMFSHVFSFNGRIRRLEYCITYLLLSIWCLPIQLLDEDAISLGYAIFFLVTLIPCYWILYAQGAKRCHDRGNSGWYQLIPFYVLWMMFAEGDKGDNEYGHSPKL